MADQARKFLKGKPMSYTKTEPADPAQSAPSAADYEAAKVWWQLQPHNATVALLAEYAALRTAQLERERNEALADSYKFQQSLYEHIHQAEEDFFKHKAEIETLKTRAETTESALREAKKLAIQECIAVVADLYQEAATNAREFKQKVSLAGLEGDRGRAFIDAVNELRALLTVAAQTPQVNNLTAETLYEGKGDDKI